MKTPVIVHVMADGKRLDSIAGKMVPADNPVYEVILKSNNKKEEKTA